jgi:biotin carboxylase
MMHDEIRPRVLMIGTDRYALEGCVRLGLDAVVVCGAAAWDNGFIRVPEQFRLVRVDDQANPEQILAALYRAGVAEDGFDAIHTSDEWALVTATMLARHFGCRTMGPGTAVHFRDKSLQKAKVAAAGVKTARVVVIDDIHDVSGLDELPFERAVLKPIAGAATARTTVVSSIDELRSRSRRYAAERTPQRVFALEEFSRGDEWVVDGVMFDGELVFAGVGRYGSTCLTAVDNDLPFSVYRLDPEADKWAYDKAVPLARTALGALGLHTGVFHMELFHDGETGTLAFGECAARRGGALIHEEIQAKFNVHLGECALACALGWRPAIDVKLRPGPIGMTFLSGRPGILISCPTPAEVMSRPGVEFARIEHPYGTTFADGIGTTNERVGQVLVGGDSEEEVNARLAEVRAWFADRLVVMPDGVRPRRLREWQRAMWPEEDFGDTVWD